MTSIIDNPYRNPYRHSPDRIVIPEDVSRDTLEEAYSWRDHWANRAREAEDRLAALERHDATRCIVPNCGREVDEFSTIGLCVEHQGEAGRNWTDWNAHERDAFPLLHDRTREETFKASIVYYIAMRDHIKIGTTTNLKRRINSFCVRPADVLAIEPGGYEREHERHVQFAQLRVGRTELFDEGPELLKHVRTARTMFGDPVDFM